MWDPMHIWSMNASKPYFVAVGGCPKSIQTKHFGGSASRACLDWKTRKAIHVAGYVRSLTPGKRLCPIEKTSQSPIFAGSKLVLRRNQATRAMIAMSPWLVFSQESTSLRCPPPSSPPWHSLVLCEFRSTFSWLQPAQPWNLAFSERRWWKTGGSLSGDWIWQGEIYGVDPLMADQTNDFPPPACIAGG